MMPLTAPGWTSAGSHTIRTNGQTKAVRATQTAAALSR
jgi:hypothetical protein